jgi:hypothetical protein
VAVLVIVVTASSSGPAVGCAVGIFIMLAWPWHRYTRAFRIGAVCLIILLQLVMKDPLWAVVAKGRIFGGSTGYYRFYLIDSCIHRFSEWWMPGTISTASWGPGLWDVCNGYVRIAVDGGVLSLALFMALIWVCFRFTGCSIKLLNGHRREQITVWALGATLTVHLFTLIGVNYFDAQISVVWYELLAVIAALPNMLRVRARSSAAGQRLGAPVTDLSELRAAAVV